MKLYCKECKKKVDIVSHYKETKHNLYYNGNGNLVGYYGWEMIVDKNTKVKITSV